VASNADLDDSSSGHRFGYKARSDVFGRLFREVALRKLIVATLLALPLLAPAARAANPNWPPPLSVSRQDLSQQQYWPDDPDYANAWMQWGFTPDAVMLNANISAAEKAKGIGMGLDAAWQRSTGDAHVVIAVMDSGFIWDRSDVLNKWLLNKNELPPPNRADCVGADPYDCNGDGVFNLADYTSAAPGGLPAADLIADQTLLARPDHGDVNGNHWLDPQDLIAVFSDGKDGYGSTVADGNGFVDDICGWDFLWDDNDAHDDVGNGGQGYSHGAAEAQDSASQGNNGQGEIGGCPNCMLLPVRGGDSFIAQASHQAMAIYYAVSRGASVIQSAQITLNNAPVAQDAIDYAWSHGAILVASSADETSLHPMVPGNLEHPLEVNGHFYDGNRWDDPNNTTFTNFSNGTNWGAHIGLSSPSSSGSDATARVSGLMGLIFSYARQLNLDPPLSAGEAYQLAIDTATDIDKGPDSGTFHSYPDGGGAYLDFHMGKGWDAHSGYGNPDARAALDWLHDGKIPPAVDITSPLWFDTFDPVTTPSVALTAVIDAPRAPAFDYQVQAAYGLEPVDADFQTVAHGTGAGHLALTGDQAISLDLTHLVPDPSAVMNVDAHGYPNGGPHQFAVALRILATAHYGGSVGDVTGQFRKTIFVHRDPDLLPGFPRKLAHAGDPGAPSASGESSPKLVDLDGDGKDEMVFGTADGFIHAMHEDGAELPGFPVRAGPTDILAHHPGMAIDDAGRADASQEIDATCAVGDVDGDGQLDIVAATMEGEVHALKLDGTELPGFPVTLDEATLPKEVPNDIGVMQQAGVWTPRAAQALPDGGAVRQLQQMDEVERGFFASPVLADLDGDGTLDIVQAGLDGYLHAWNGKGQAMPGFPVQVRDARGGTDGDGDLTIRGRLIGTPAVGDVNGDGRPEILTGSNEVYENKTVGRAYLIKPTGAPDPAHWSAAYLPGWPIALPGLYLDLLPYVGRGNPDSPLMADLDGDGVPELFTHPVATSAEVFDVAGTELLSTAQTISDPSSTATSRQGVDVIAVNMGAVADLDGDGQLDYVDGTVPILATERGAAGAIRHDYDHQVTAWGVGRALASARAHEVHGVVTAPMLRAFPQVTTDYQFVSNYAVADVNGDGNPEVISGNGGFEVTAFDKDGKQPAGWPKLTGGWNMATPAVGDLDGDGYLDVVTLSRNGYLWAWKTHSPANGNVQWPSFHHDLRNTGNTATPLQTRRGPTLDGDGGKKSGCGCNPGGPLGLDGFGLLALGILGLGRRRRR